MTPGQLVKAVSISLDVPVETVVQHDRNLVVAGLRTTGARGSNAPSVTHRDAARLIVSILGSAKVRDSVSIVKRLEEVKVWSSKEDYISLPFPRLAELPENHSFVDALTAIIEEVDTPQMFDDFPEFARRFGTLLVYGGASHGSMSYHSDEDVIDVLYQETEFVSDFWDWATYFGVEQERHIRGNCLMILGLCFQKGLPASRGAVFRTWKTASKKAVG